MIGTIATPLKLSSALNHGLIRDGHILYLRGGTYSGDFINYLSGSILIRPYQNEAVVIDGAFTVNGANITFRDITFTYSGWTGRQSAEAGSYPSDIPYAKGVTINAPGCKFINCTMHDMGGLGLWVEAVGALFYGCHVYHIGWLGTDRGHGHGLYMQNSSDKTMTVKHCIFHDCFGWGIHAYSTTGAKLINFLVDGNISFCNGSLAGANRMNILFGADKLPASNIDLKNNCTFGGAAGVQFYGAGAKKVTLKDNYCADGITGIYTAASETGNVKTLGNAVKVFRNEYDANRLHVAIYNAAAKKTVDVDVSAYYDNGDTVNAHNAQDWTDVQELTVSAGVVTVNMQAANRTVATPYQWTAPASTFPKFGAFIMVKQ